MSESISASLSESGIDIDDQDIPLVAADSNTPDAPRGEVSDIVDIGEVDIPLGVIDEEDLNGEPAEDDTVDIGEIEIPLESTAAEDPDKSVAIDEEEVPLAEAAAAGVNWSWIPVVGAIMSGLDGLRGNKKKKKSEDQKDDQKKDK